MKRRKPTRSPKYRDYTEPLKDPDAAARPPSKKRKPANRGRSTPNMAAFDFQTPHPTLGSQSQTFRLPSSSPQPSSRPLSPVPSATSSKHFKENAPKHEKFPIDPEASSTPWTRHSSNPFASMMRMSGHIPPLPRSRKSRPRAGRHRPSRSHSRSSSNSNVSSRANSKEPHTRKPIPPPNTHPESTLKHTPSLSASESARTHPAPPRPKQGSRKSAAAQGPSLASPFVSRASSPAPHIPTTTNTTTPPDAPRKSSARTVLRDLRTPDPNLPQPSDPARPPHPAAWLQNVRSSLELERAAAAHTLQHPRKINLTQTAAARNTRRPGTLGGFSLYAQAQQQQHLGSGTGDRARRPSAPSSLHIMPKALRATTAPAAGRLSVLGPGRASTGGVRTPPPAERGLLSPPADLQDKKAAAPASAVQVPMDQRRRAPPPSTATQDGARGADDDARAIPPPKLAVSSARQHLLHASASLDDLHRTEGQGRRAGDHHHHHPSAADDSEDDKRTAWMRTRAGVDFNRPPSQMDVAAGGGAFPHHAGFEETFFTSSEDEFSAEEGAEDECGSEDGAADAHFAGAPFRFALRDGVQSGFGFGFGFEDPDHARALGGAFALGKGGHDEGGACGEEEEWARFGEDALGVSTPAQDPPGALHGKEDGGTRRAAPRRVVSLPSLRQGPVQKGKGKGSANAAAAGGGGGGGVLARSVSYDDLQAYQREVVDEDGDKEVDMELTGSAAGGGRVREAEEEEDEEEDGREDGWDGAVSWITDSLISAPSIYLERKRQQAAVQDQDQVEDDHTKEQKSSSSTLDGPSFRSPFRLSAGPGAQDVHGAAGGLHLLPALDVHAGAQEPEDRDAHSSGSYTHSSSSSGASAKTATRTRSGTIVPAHPLPITTSAAAGANPIPPGSRRTRSGTIVGPLPAATPPPAFALPPRPDGSVGAPGVGHAHARVGKAPVRTRSGTIVASASVPRAVSDTPAARGQEATEDGGVDVCYTDSLYVPDASSPDPIDFLRFAGIAEAEDEEDGDVEWRVVRAPPSPETRRRRQQQPRGRGRGFPAGGRWVGKGKGAAARKGLPARRGGGVEDDDEDALGDAEDSSEDELLLVP
ncbi:hypothetical protein BJ912DRAFT_1139909 [Pholiota molesta]|nr:hypothetical protein BJ912DRAFT_1139909 [Pholiota molesta]